jgi:hypothetical protein
MRARNGVAFNALGRLCLLSGALSACGGKSLTEIPRAQRDTSALFGSGTRLKAHYWDGGDGARELVDFYDSELQASCEFVESTSGQYECLPTLRTFDFFDADCSEPAYRALCGKEPPHAGQLVSSFSAECEALVNVYSLGEERAVSALYSLGTGECVAHVSPPKTAWSLVHEPLTRFVQGSLSVVGAEGGLQASRVTGDDGAFTNLGLMAEGKPCSQVMVRGVPHCMPGLFAAPSGNAFEDASCEGPMLAIGNISDGERCAGQRAEYVREAKPENCVPNDSLHVALDDVGDVYYANYVGSTNQCVAWSSSADSERYSFYHTGAELSAEHAPPMGNARVGTGSLKLSCQTDREGVPLFSADAHALIPQAWQTESGQNCGPIPDLNGTLRCVPFSLGLPTPTPGELGPFSDASCTQRVVGLTQGQCSNALQDYAYFIEAQSVTSCTSALAHAYRVQPYSGPLFEQRDGTCTPASPWPKEAYIVPGAEIDLASFPLITDVTEQ